MAVNGTKLRQSYNLGIELLRVIMIFWVILYHCFRTDNKKIEKIIIMKRFHVPTFMFISFYFFYPLINKRNISKIKEKLVRLLIPYIIWPLLIWLFNNILFILFHKNRINRRLYVIEFIYQLIFGIKIYGIIWFNGVLILFIITFTIISLIFKNNYIFLLQIISFLIYIFDYSNYNPKLYYKSLTWIFLGRILGMFPIAVTSISLSSINVISKLKYIRYKIILFCLANIIFLLKYDIFITNNGYVYRSVVFNIAAINFFFGFSLLPIEMITNKYIILILQYITKYTGGIYYIHWIVKDILENKIKSVNRKTFIGCINIYFISYFICSIGIIFFGKTKLRNLFC